MKPITLARWKIMSPDKRSWLVCRALGETAHIFWHCISENGKTIGGSYGTMAECEKLIRYANEAKEHECIKHGIPFPHPFATCHPVPSVAFPRYAEYDHLGIRLGMDILKERGAFKLRMKGSSVRASTWRHSAEGDTIEEAASLLVLKLKGLVKV